MTRFVGHLPLVRLDPGTTSLDLPRGRLRSVPFDEWHAMDSSFPDRHFQYERSAPAFFELDTGPDAGHVEAFSESTDEGTALLWTWYRALLLLTAARLPRPDLSVCYLIIEGADLPVEIREQARSIQYRRVGPAERELIVHADQHHPVPVNADDIDGLAAVWQLLETGREMVRPVIEALVRTTRPGFTPLNEALHLIAGLEAVLVARGEPLSATFARRYSVLAADDDVEELRAHARQLYGLRSDLVHGRPIKVDHSGRRDSFLRDEHRHWTCVVAQRALQWLGAHPGARLEDLRHVLDQASTSPDELVSVRSAWSQSDG